MAHELNASICAVLPEEAEAMAKAAATIMLAWHDFLKVLATEGLQSSLTINETRAKPAAKANGERQPRTRRTAAQIEAERVAALGGGAAGGDLGV